MSTKKESKNLLETVKEKIQDLAKDFQDNRLSREQYNLIYSRYHRQLGLALSVRSGDDTKSTNAIPTMTMKRADGVTIYHQASNTVLETLGKFTLASDNITPILEESKPDDVPKIVALDEQWLIILAGKWTTVILQYSDAPKESFFTTLERLKADFEHANQHLLANYEDTHLELAQPFVCAVKALKK